MSNSGYVANARQLPAISLPSAGQAPKETLRTLLRRCPRETVEAAVQFRRTRSPEVVPVIVRGVIFRYIEVDRRELLQAPREDLRLSEDLGLDSLSLIEISMTLEDVLEVSLSEDKLRHLRTLGDISRYARQMGSA
ncbi:MAG: acyl carrier protein [Cephaloticoccus sp.]